MLFSQTLSTILDEDVGDDVARLIIRLDGILVSRKFLSGLSSQFSLFSHLLVSWIRYLVRLVYFSILYYV